MKIAFQRASEGQFFVSPNCNESTINSLVHDGILGYETAGYFITHDIYEEWALEKIIESEFIRQENHHEFLKKIGESLPIRRSFRKWVSDKLLTEDDSIENFIEEVIEDENIPYFWKDEVLVSVLLSSYSDHFINLFEEKLLENNQKLLNRATFLLRIACKEVDEDYLKGVGLDKYSISYMQYIFTKPKGKGWESIIKLIYKNKDKIEVEKLNFILPIINEWNNKFKSGETTKLSALIALEYYQVIVKEDIYLSRGEGIEEKLIQTILYGAAEIKEELTTIFDKIIKNEWRNYRDPYYNLVNAILSKVGENQEILKSLPNYVLSLADLYWFNPQEKRHPFHYSVGVEGDFCIDENQRDYYPPSAFQTPIYWLLKYSLKETVDFLLRFINKTVECYVNSDLDKSEVKEVEVVTDSHVVKQYISTRLWNTYRGTQVSPNVFQSIHMALEKFLLETAKNTDSKILESNLLYLIKNSNSSSLTAIVVSVVLAYPEKTFNIAKVLFQTKEFFFYDSRRMILEHYAKSQYLIGAGLIPKNKIYKDERIKSCNDSHRKKTLENLALMYQLFKGEAVTDEEAEKRQKAIWAIFDQYYRESTDDSGEDFKTWRLFLARMDRRKMNPTFEEVDEGLQINLNPEVDPGLKEYSEVALQESSEAMKYLSLKLWADYKVKNDEKYKEYTKYEENPKQALKEVKQILEKLKKSDVEFQLSNKAIPAHVCTVLVRDYFEELSKSEKELCKDLILTFASSSFRPNYMYQIWDGVEAAISVLPLILEKFPEEKEYIKGILLLTLFDSHSIGMYKKFSDYSAETILNNLWDISYDDAQSLLLGFLYLKPKYDEMRESMRQEHPKQNKYKLYENELIETFIREYEKDIERVITNSITLDEIKYIKNINLCILRTAFQLIPLNNYDESHKIITQHIITAFAEKLLSNDREDIVDYEVSHDFLRKFSRIVLTSHRDDVSLFLQPFIESFNNNEPMADLFEEFILAEDILRTYDNFWLVWDLFYDKVAQLSKGESYYNQKIIKSYLFASIPWNEDVSEWHAFKDNNKRFLSKVARRMGESPSVLYSIAKLLNGVGQKYLNNGITWISKLLIENNNIWAAKLEENTTYHLENLVKSYIYKNRERIKRETKLKQEVLVILNFLVEKGSVAGYMLRENVL